MRYLEFVRLVDENCLFGIFILNSVDSRTA